MKINMILSLLTVFILLSSQNASANYFKDFPTTISKNLVTDYGANNYDIQDDTPQLQKAIDQLSQEGGGQIIIPKGVYYFFNVQLKSNIKILIDQHATIRPYKNKMFKHGSNSIFSVSENNTNLVQNVEVTCLQKGKRFTVQFPVIRAISGDNPSKSFNNVYGIRVFNFFNVKNFSISNFNVYDSKTKYSSVEMGAITTPSNIKNRGQDPTTGDVKNITVFNAAYGYGAVQVQAANNIFFKNIESDGGAALRLETGFYKTNNLQIGGVQDIKANNIRCINGSAALTLSPHALHTDKNIEAQNIKSNGCGFAVRIAGGFVSQKYTTKGLTKGSFKNVSIHGVDATFGMHSQILDKDFTFLPKELQRYIYRTNTRLEALSGPSIAAVGYVAGPGEKVNYDVSITGIKTHGFKNKAIITNNDRYKLYTTEH
ncbi:Iota-carrageenase A2 [Marinomonas flavescens]|uniref:Iota-carrageenase A2 n=1 Tax=Marinomonas flavescens TaxID=2529379 RepID=UPI001056BE33|nr:Iota-carrageenase A2 [Marinomonas flavescens]